MMLLIVVLSLGWTARTETMLVPAAVCPAVAQDLVRMNEVIAAMCRPLPPDRF